MIGPHLLPPQVQDFILNSTDRKFPLWRLIKFWSEPRNISFTRDRAVWNAAMRLAAVYVKRDMIHGAQALIINAAFINECTYTSIEHVKALFQSGVTITKQQLPYFYHGLVGSTRKESMVTFIQTYMPGEFIDNRSGDWEGTSSASMSLRRKPSSTNAGTQITLVLVDDTNKDAPHGFNIGTSTTLKASFNAYATKRGVSLRSLRFFYAGKPLFLSGAAHKTPEELGMSNEDSIVVRDTSSEPQPPLGNSASQEVPTSKKNKAPKRSHARAKGKRRSPRRHADPARTLEEYKIQHSKRLTKIHEEAQARFKRIRQSLNNLVLNRIPPKLRPNRPPEPTEHPSLLSRDNMHFEKGLGGKAGKSCYAIQVGEVQHLYKTSKKSAAASRHTSPAKVSTLDLHGYTRAEAVAKLDESLEAWVETAMRGSYPFVRSASIVCGGGNQILSRTVQEWIRANDRVSHAHAVRSGRRRGRA